MSKETLRAGASSIVKSRADPGAWKNGQEGSDPGFPLVDAWAQCSEIPVMLMFVILLKIWGICSSPHGLHLGRIVKLISQLRV